MAHESIERREQAHGSSDLAFGIVFGIALLAIGVSPWFFGRALRIWALIGGMIFVATALVLPSLLAPLNRIWTRFGLLLQKITSPIVLGIMFFLVITPMGLVMRWLGHDPMRRRFDPTLASYWLERTPPGPRPESLSDQF